MKVYINAPKTGKSKKSYELHSFVMNNDGNIEAVLLDEEKGTFRPVSIYHIETVAKKKAATKTDNKPATKTTEKDIAK